MFKRITIILLVVISLSFSCTTDKKNSVKDGGYTDGTTTLFTKITPDNSLISFQNTVREDLEFNFLNYPYLYTGAGVAVGDIDGDNLEDVYLTSNFGPNKLYKNNGDFTFEDITKKSKAEDYEGFTTGATMLDVNNDGWLDIYVSKAGSLKSDDGRRNKLFVNQKDGTFKEEARKWGVDDPGYSTQAYPLDYDKDGDLDLYVINYRYDFRNNTKISGSIQKAIEETTSDQLYRNDGNTFTKVTGEAGIYNKAWGLSGAVGDFNNDGWDDIYVSNDYLEPDLLYINQRNGTFKNEANKRVNHISFNSMGSDYADLNNDGYPDLVTVDMLAENYARSKENMASMSTENFNSLVEIGYHHAYMANMLHYNNGNGKYKETSQLSGIVKTDWSWAPLLADFDNDGYKDIFISNGVYKDYNNQDFRRELRARNEKGESMTLQAVLDLMPSQKLNNYMYKNNGDLSFTKVIKEWGLEDPGFSNGAAYTDLDNDGDLDLIVNNVNGEIGLYRNNINVNSLKIKLKGPATNSLGIGAEITVKSGNETQYQKLYLTRGFQSSISPALHFGLGNLEAAEEVTVRWPDGKISKQSNIPSNTTLTFSYSDATQKDNSLRYSQSQKKSINPSSIGINYVHQENDYNDYDDQLLLPQKQSTKGTGVTVGDINGDGLEDFFVGNALGATPALYKQQEDGSFIKTNESLWSREAKYEDSNALFFDADGDGDQDLYVVSTGYELPENDPLLQDRLYLNDGSGNFKISRALPKMLTAGKAVQAADYDQDGDLDLFVGGNIIPGKYPLSPNSYLLRNESGKFKDITSNSPELKTMGMVSDVLFTDYDKDDDLDLFVVGEWMQPTIFENNDGAFTKSQNLQGLEQTEGWWFSITSEDYDNDGDPDYVLGNLGRNNKFQPTTKKPLSIHAKDFDDNGSFDVALSKVNNGKLVPVRGRECSSEQNPFLLDKIGTYKEFASLEFEEIYGEDRLKDAHLLQAYQFESVYLNNLGDGSFEVSKLPNEAQTGPTLSLLSKDINKDGHVDVIGVGAIYDAEVETIRYDSNYGYVLINDGQGKLIYDKTYDPFIDRDAKDLTQISIKGKPCYLAVSNNAPLEVFTYEP